MQVRRSTYPLCATVGAAHIDLPTSSTCLNLSLLQTTAAACTIRPGSLGETVLHLLSQHRSELAGTLRHKRPVQILVALLPRSRIDDHRTACGLVAQLTPSNFRATAPLPNRSAAATFVGLRLSLRLTTLFVSSWSAGRSPSPENGLPLTGQQVASQQLTRS